MHTLPELPVTFLSQESQIVGMLHQARGKHLVIFCHGFLSSKNDCRRIFVEAARTFAAEGIDTLRFDFYGSGDSAGAFSDSLISRYIANLRDAIDWGRQRGYDKIAVVGLSMGGAVAILTLAETPADALITWSSVPDMQQTFLNYVGNLEDIATRVEEYVHDGWVIRKGFWEEALQYDIHGALARITIPKFIIQGTGDAPVFVEGFSAFRDLVQPPADFMEIPDASHTYSLPAHRHQVIRQSLIWLKRTL
ncbi:MAG TPA: alpha/beta fold hydrolase [bacterium]|nr:alpha/beta fold hydrolase [bacterium]HPR88968.1 alpha/beta fold hydrolase [bacterium]